MQGALVNQPITNFPVPEDIQFLKIQSESGEPANFSDADSNFELFLQEFLPEKEKALLSQHDEEIF